MKKSLFLILLGTVLMAAAVNLAYEPLEMVTGGFSGLGILVKRVTSRMFSLGFPVWFTNAALNIPLFLIAFRMKGRHFIMKTLFATVSFTVALSVLPVFPVLEDDYLLTALTGGILSGTGLGLVFITGSSTGGTDLLGSVLWTKCKRGRVSTYIVAADTAVVLMGAALLGLRSALYAVIAVFTAGRVMDLVMERGHASRACFIISEHSDVITKAVFERLGRGVTGMEGTGKYTGKRKEVLLCIVGKKEIAQLTELVKQNDKKAFLLIMDAREVRGEGFALLE